MAKVTSKLQVTVPKVIAERFGIKPGSDIEWEAADQVIRIIPVLGQRSGPSVEARLSSFDAATKRQRQREQRGRGVIKKGLERGWRREDLYKRGRAG